MDKGNRQAASANARAHERQSPNATLPDATAQRRRTKAPKKKGAKDAKAQAASASRHANR